MSAEVDTDLRWKIHDLETEIEDLLGFMYVCPVGVVQTTPDGNVRLINPFASELLMPAMLRAPSSTANLFDILGHCLPDLRAMVTAFGQDRGDILTGRRIVIGAAADNPRVASLSVMKISHECLMAVLQDVTAEVRREQEREEEKLRRETERKAREDAERDARIRSDFLATMSHEIRSPLSGLLGVLEVLRGTELQPEQQRMANMIQNSGTMLLSVLNDVLDFSKIEADALSIELRPTVLREFLHEVVQPIVVAADRKGVGFSHAVEPGVPDGILADTLRLRQILGNLLSNALKFTANGKITLRVMIAGKDGGPHLAFHVADSGIGIEPAVLPRLFNPFKQADGSTTRKFGGTGLGLAISKKLSALMDGDLTVTSEFGVGSVFSLVLPLLPCSSVAGADSTNPGSRRRLAKPGQRILVADDDSTMRWLATKQLTDLGYAVDTENDGEAAFQRFQSRSYDLVLTDCHMPRMDGEALARSIRALPDGAGATVPIIGLTADVTEEQRDRCLAAGMNELVTKPLTIDRLSQMLDHRLNGAAAPASARAPQLRSVPFDESIYRATFDPGDAEGAAWLEEYLVTAREEIDAITAALAPPAEGQDPAPPVSKIAHRLAGTSFSVGAMMLGDGARALEVAALNGQVAALPVLAASLEARFTEAKGAIAGFLAL